MADLHEALPALVEELEICQERAERLALQCATVLEEIGELVPRTPPAIPEGADIPDDEFGFAHMIGGNP